MTNNPFLSIVIPAYNEEENIKRGAPHKVFSYLRDQDYLWEVIFVDDGSADKTVRLLSNFVKKDSRMKLIQNPHQGKAATVTIGIMAAKGDIVLFNKYSTTKIDFGNELILRAEDILLVNK